MRYKKKNTGRTVLFVLLALVLIAGIAAFITYNNIKNYDKAFDESSDELVDFEISAGSSTSVIAKKLFDYGLIKNPELFRYKAKFNKLDSKFQAGQYLLSPSMTMSEIMEQIQHGKRETVMFTVPEGLTLIETAEALAKQGIVSESDFFAACEDYYAYDFLPENGTKSAKVSALANRLEGYLYPETYSVYKDSSAHDVIDRMLSQFKKTIDSKLEGNVPSGYSLNDMVILASVIEKECGADSERNTISGVFWNRLNTGMMLQSDVTILYALPEGKAFSTSYDSPYNTYVVKGLPVGPICSPSLKSINAAINPESHNYFYFVLKGDGSGTCFFASNYDEHLKNVAKYRENIRKK